MRNLICVLLLVGVTTVHAAPAPANDDMDRFLVEKGFLTQLDQVRVAVSHKASDLVINAVGFWACLTAGVETLRKTVSTAAVLCALCTSKP